jgi:hypothetical protein
LEEEEIIRMRSLSGVSAIRMAALMYANHGLTMKELVEFIKQKLPVTRSEVAREARAVGVREGRGGRLRLSEKVTPFLRGLPEWCVPSEGERQSGGSAA